ncbi:MAG: phage tail sheath C-terminal domain-containing protein [Bacteroidota bacterium]
MAKHKTPGVFNQQFQPRVPSVAQVETAIPAFIGYTEKAQDQQAGDLLQSPKRITTMLEYDQFFGAAAPEKGITVKVNTKTSPLTVEAEITAPSNYLMYYALRAFFDNGGGACYIVSVGDYSGGGDISKAALLQGLEAAGEVDEVSLVVFPEGTKITPAADYYALVDASLEHCRLHRDRFTICDIYMHQDAAVNDVEQFRAATVDTVEQLQFGACYYPDLEMLIDHSYQPEDVQVTRNGKTTTLDKVERRDPKLYDEIKRAITQIPLILPPSPSIAGVYASVDRDRGVWKAPANVSISAVMRPTVSISDPEQDSLNVDLITGKSINAIRSLEGRGILVWGARTLAGNDNEWRYVPIRRFLMMVEESITQATLAVVFEPNDANTWVQVRAMVENFLMSLWRQGALMGNKPEQSYFVKVGLGETMTAKDILENRMIIEIGMAVVRPAEFIVFRITQQMAQA